MSKETLEFHEFEVKFRMDEAQLNAWKQLIINYKKENEDSYKEFIYIDSDDIYYVKDVSSEDVEYDFIRYRFSDSKKDKRAELTTKKKLKDTNNIKRIEYNVRVDNNSKETVDGFVTGLGYNINFRIMKFVSIYKFKDATLPFYTVVDDSGNRQSFCEIEVDEELLHKIDEEEAWEIVKKYEKILEPLGVSPQKRLRKSLYEMYKK